MLMQFQAKLIQIGNSKGVRIPSAIIEASGLNKQLSIELTDSGILLKPIHENPRKGWSEAFKAMHNNRDDKMFIPDSLDIKLISETEW